MFYVWWLDLMMWESLKSRRHTVSYQVINLLCRMRRSSAVVDEPNTVITNRLTKKKKILIRKIIFFFVLHDLSCVYDPGTRRCLPFILFHNSLRLENLERALTVIIVSSCTHYTRGDRTTRTYWCSNSIIISSQWKTSSVRTWPRVHLLCIQSLHYYTVILS